VPRYAVSAGLIFGEGDLDFGELVVAPLPIPGADGLLLGGGFRRLDDEALNVVAVEAVYPLFDEHVRPRVELDFAWPDARLRAARLRVDAGIAGAGRVDIDPRTALGWWHGRLEAFVEASRFDSAAVDAAGGEAALGYAVGISGRVGLRAGELEVSGFMGRDRVETLTRLPDAGGRSEQGLGILFRLGW